MTALPKVGQTVQYVGSEDIIMAAVIIMTGETWSPKRDPNGLSKPSSDTSVTLKVLRPASDRSYVRKDVPLAGSPEHDEMLALQAEYDEALAAFRAELADKAEQAAIAQAEYSATLAAFKGEAVDSEPTDLPEIPAVPYEFVLEHGKRPVVRVWRFIPA
jgi:hypothetical protein